MPSLMPPQPDADSRGPARPWSRRVYVFFRRWPFLSLFLIVVASNAAGSFFNITYNKLLIVEGVLDPMQKDAFEHVALPLYNLLAYPICLAIVLYLLLPLRRCRSALLAGEPVSPASLEFCRRRLINLPLLAVYLNFFGWIPGAVFFPLLVCGVGGAEKMGLIWTQFSISFAVSAVLTTVQTFIVVEAFLIAVLYPDFFRDARPAEIRGAWRVPFRLRLALLWAAVAMMPLVAVLAVVNNFGQARGDARDLRGLAWAVGAVASFSGAIIFWLVGRDVLAWIKQHAAATEQIEMGNLDVRIREQRPDEWGQLTDRFNDMAAALRSARDEHETFGQFVNPRVRDAIMERYPGLGGEVKDITVLFADIRGFTRRTAGEAPDRVVELLNQFLTFAVRAVEERGGQVNKFLGDGVMALFNAEPPCADHADRAVASALDLLTRLELFNAELARRQESGLVIGIGIHTGPALVGCVGATLWRPDGRGLLRRELTAIGETVNVCQRLEQLTKLHGGPILLSENTRRRLTMDARLTPVGPLVVPGLDDRLMAYRAGCAAPVTAIATVEQGSGG
jgi:adenylate cyclase